MLTGEGAWQARIHCTCNEMIAKFVTRVLTQLENIFQGFPGYEVFFSQGDTHNRSKAEVRKVRHEHIYVHFTLSLASLVFQG
jgi:hypothetical protein